MNGSTNTTDRSVGFLARVLCGTSALCAIVACSSRDGFVQKNDVFDPTPDAGAPAVETPVCGLHCSRDLKQVLDGCVGGPEPVVATCSADEGCGDGKCVDACTAAALSKGSVGCDFWTVPPTSPTPAYGGCYAVMVANTWDRSVSIDAEYGTGALDISKSTYTVRRENNVPKYTRLEGPLPPGEVAVVFLAHDEAFVAQSGVACPDTVTPALLVAPIKNGTVRNKAFHVKTDAPVSAYAIAPYGGAPSFEPTATLLLPASSWEKNYVTVSPELTSIAPSPDSKRRTLQIIASQDDTEVSIRPTTAIVGSAEVTGGAAGTTQTWTLAKGEVLQFAQDSLTGSPIEATKPIGVFGGAECSFVPATIWACDMLQQQLPPLAQWGTEYAVVPFAPRIVTPAADVREQVPYTIVGAVDGTVLTYEPSRPRDAPERLDANQSVSFLTDEIFVVKSQDSKHPFHVNVYMTGGDYGGGTSGKVMGDPEFVNVPASDQYLDRYVFFTDFTYPDTTLTVVRRKTRDGFLPVELGCGGTIEGFKPLGSSGEYEYAWVTLTNGFVDQLAKDGACTSYGRQEARSDGPFAVTVWGMGLYASYGYVGGTGLRPINDARPTPIK